MAGLADGRVVSGHGRSLRIWDAHHGQVLATFESPSDVQAVSPDGRVICCYTMSVAACDLRVWDMKRGTDVITNLTGHQHPITAVAALPGNRVVSASWDKTLRVWDVESGQALATFTCHEHPITSVAVFPDGRIVSGSEDGTFRVWDVDSGQTLATLQGHQGKITALAALPDGRIVAGFDDGTLRVCGMASGQTLTTLEGHRTWITGMAVFPDGRIVTSSRDKTLRVWDVESGQTLATIWADETFSCRYGESFSCVAVVSQHLIVAGDVLGNVWFIDIP